MKKLLILILMMGIIKVAKDKLDKSESGLFTDYRITSFVDETNRQLPIKFSDEATMHKIEYTNGVLRYFVNLHNGLELTHEDEQKFSNDLRKRYCSGHLLKGHKVDVEFLITKTGLRSLNDRITAQTWTFVVHPNDCA